MKRRVVKISDILDSRRMDVAYFLNGDIGSRDLVPLSRYVDIKGGKRIPKGESFTFEKTNYLYLRLSDVDDVDNINYEALKCISEDLYCRLKRYEITNNQIVFSIAGTIGKVFVIKNIPTKKRVVLTENCAMLQPKSDKIISEYISILLNCSFVQKQIEQNRIQTTIPKMGLDRINKLKVPKIPLLGKQQEIVEIYSNAQRARLNKIQEANVLLDSIDDYLSEVLQIDMSQNIMTNNTSFFKRISSIIGNRMDVSFYKNRFEMISKKYPNEKLSSLVEVDPAIGFNCFDSDMPISFVPMECIDEEFGEISEYRETTVLNTRGYTKFKENDLLWAKITPCMQNGKSAIARNLTNGVGCGSTEYYVLRPQSDGLLIDYVYLILRHHKVLEAAQSSFGGSAGQQRVSSQYLKSIKIPYPDISMQKDIVRKIYEMKDKAKRLQLEGDALLEKAKQEIEKMIIG